MAIQKSYTDPQTGAVYPVAYWRIVGVTLRAATATVHVEGYVDATSAGGGKVAVDSRSITMGAAAYAAAFPADALVSEITARVYTWLKARAEYAGGTDV